VNQIVLTHYCYTRKGWTIIGIRQGIAAGFMDVEPDFLTLFWAKCMLFIQTGYDFAPAFILFNLILRSGYYGKDRII
jgi:hypothetical protein